jgi:hypothetical protein
MLIVAEWSPVPAEPVKTVFQDRQTGKHAHGQCRVRYDRADAASSTSLRSE